ncbi:MAG: hypothetical protein A2493_00300 [Candidatus Magasanikbacteria bacterium RIFOXYC12_FULL_33_11]|uniref:Uncharacterized protein n=1 Tax=Candidatus Magasanikbacteria bacterium RIFOXYC12_FULL_33_11 TaxID=1798701 RepID=A0A1F6NQ45_9BACT|nr:MAG: hypothetical protein A2493_00300 [Candidatus Magasanikbacteria bacterium RIFOXYC12_FULL_33_11]
MLGRSARLTTPPSVVEVLDRHLHPPDTKVIVGECVGLVESQLLVPLCLVTVVDVDDGFGRNTINMDELESEAPQLRGTDLLVCAVIDGGVVPIVALPVGKTVHSLRATGGTSEVLPAVAGEAVDLVGASPTVLAGIGIAMIDRHHRGVGRGERVLDNLRVHRDVGVTRRNVSVLRGLVGIRRHDVSVGRLVRVILHQGVRRHRSIGGDERVVEDLSVRRRRVGVGRDGSVRLRHGVDGDVRVVVHRLGAVGDEDIARKRVGGLENIRRRRRITLPQPELTGAELKKEEDGRDDQNELRHGALQAWSK